jgi:hypothetical protein
MADTQMIARSVETIDRGALATADVVSRVRRVQEIMTALMKEGTHFGTIPGTPKPTLYQPGAELLCMTFRVAPDPHVEDLSTGEAVRYRVTMRGVHQQTGEILGAGVGECSSDEEKYRWRRPICDEEWAETPDDLRREKWARGKSVNYKAKQVRMSPADIANTILKMAFKRAHISMTRIVLACSDIFAQDLEDLPAEVREAIVTEEAAPVPPISPKPSNGGATISEKQVGRFWAIAKSKKWDEAQVRALLAGCHIEHTKDIKVADYDDLISALDAGPATGGA